MNIFIFDLETSGLNPYRDDIIEIGIKKYQSDKSYQKLVVPQSKELISDRISELTGITNDEIFKSGIGYMNAYIELYNFIVENSDKSSPIVYLISHNGNAFDFIFFKRILYDLKSSGEDLDEFEFRYLDTLNFSRRLTNHNSYKMSSLCKRFNIQNSSEHRAMGDVMALENIFNKLYILWTRKDELTDIKEMDKMIKYINFDQ